jgi:hypothetical protein
MFYYLVQHPNIYDTPSKEPHFLAEDFPGLNIVHSMEEYEALFAGAQDIHTLRGEGSLSYLYSKTAAHRIMELDPESKLILMLRNPIQIVQSLHMHSLAMLTEDEPDFKKAWALQDMRARGDRIPAKNLEPFFLQYREVGKLGKYLERLREIVPEQQIKLIFQEDLKTQVREIYDDLLEFLGAPPFEAVNFAVMNESKSNRSQLLAHVTERELGLRTARRLKPLRKFFGLENVSLRSKLRRFNRVKSKREPLDKEFEAMLKDYFRDDVKLLEKLSGRDLSHWLQ